jgi:hypothetical protein
VSQSDCLHQYRIYNTWYYCPVFALLLGYWEDDQRTGTTREWRLPQGMYPHYYPLCASDPAPEVARAMETAFKYRNFFRKVGAPREDDPFVTSDLIFATLNRT